MRHGYIKMTPVIYKFQGINQSIFFGTKSKNAKRARYSGGLAVYFKNEQKKNFVKVIEKSSHGFLWVKIKGDLFSFKEDVIFGHVYFPDAKSKMFKQGGEEVEYFDILENYILQFQGQAKIFIFGDWNCHCGSESSDSLRFDKYLDDESDLFIDLLFRQSKDHVIDMRGRNLLSFCHVTDLCIANDRIESGEFTYCSQRGQSTVDYLLTDYFDLHLIKEFKILPFNEFSDHAPLLVVFSSNQLASKPESDISETFTKLTRVIVNRTY